LYGVHISSFISCGYTLITLEYSPLPTILASLTYFSLRKQRNKNTKKQVVIILNENNF